MARTDCLRHVLIVLCCAVAPSQVHAQKTLLPEGNTATVPLSAILALAKPYPNLRQEIRLARIAANANPDAAACTARRLGNEWSFLFGQTLGPYRCRIGSRTLDVTTSPTFYDGAKHKLLPTATNLASRAKSVTETRLQWRWL